MHPHLASSRASAKFLHRPARSLRRTISLLSTFGAVAGVQLQTSRSIKPRERDLGDLRLFFLARFLTRPTNHPRHAACASNFKSKPVRPRNFESSQYSRFLRFGKAAEDARRRFQSPLDHHGYATRLTEPCDGTSAAAPASSPVATPSSSLSPKVDGLGFAPSSAPISPIRRAGNFRLLSPTGASLEFRALFTRTTGSS